MATITETIDINAPIDRVFAAITDPRRSGEWNANIVDVSIPSPLPLQVGTCWRQTAMMMGRQVHLTCCIVHLEPPIEGRLDVTGDQRATITTTCSPIDGGTRVTQIVEFVPPGGLLGSVATAVITPVLKREIQRTMQRAREVCEQEADHGSPIT